jgi:hypothetical protein
MLCNLACMEFASVSGFSLFWTMSAFDVQLPLLFKEGASLLRLDAVFPCTDDCLWFLSVVPLLSDDDTFFSVLHQFSITPFCVSRLCYQRL